MSAVLGPALALLSSVLWGSADFAGGLLSRRRAAAAVVGGSQAFGLAGVGVAVLVTGAAGGAGAPTGWLPWSAAAGLSATVGLVSFYAALATGTMGVVSPIAALGAVVPVLVGVATGERPSGVQVAGILLALAGAAAASGPELRGTAGARPVVLAVVAGASFGMALYFLGVGSRTSPLLTLLGMRVTSVAVFLAAALVLRSAGGLRRSDVLPLAAIGVADAAANLAFGIAATMGLLSVTAVLGSLYPVVTVLLARAVLHERLRGVQQGGVSAAFGGVLLISVG